MRATTRLSILLFLLALGFLGASSGLEPATAEEPKKGPEEGDDLGDQDVPFHEQVNQAIDRGVNWLLARPDRFSDRKNQFVHYGRINSPTLWPSAYGSPK